MYRMLRVSLAGFAAFAAAGCSTPVPVALDAHTDIPAGFTAPKAANAAPILPAPDWWSDFRTNELQELETTAWRDNLDLAAAAARVDQAEANARAAFAPLLPTLGATAGDTRSRPAGLPANNGAGSGPAYNSFSMGLQASYQLDFWGLQQDLLRQARENAKSAHYAEAVVGLTVSADVATEYFTALALRERIAATRRDVAAGHDILDITRAKVDAGVISYLALSQEQATVSAEETTLPQLIEAEREARYALALLLGRAPENFDISATSLDGIVSPLIAAGLPSDLLARRPDIAEAEANLAASHANVDAARAAFFPQIGLTGSGIYSSSSLATLLDPASLGWSIGASLVQTIFDGGKLQAGSDLAKAQQAEQLADYRNAVFSAFSDVETALGSIASAQDQLVTATEEAQAAAEAFRISDVQYRAGTIDILSVLQSQQLMFQADNALVQTKLARYQADVTLYQALGGGWTKPDPDQKLADR
jgi:NodT family efflux transporter outer membrane factor (OMF) lipoprotein